MTVWLSPETASGDGPAGDGGECARSSGTCRQALPKQQGRQGHARPYRPVPALCATEYHAAPSRSCPTRRLAPQLCGKLCVRVHTITGAAWRGNHAFHSEDGRAACLAQTPSQDQSPGESGAS